MFARITFAIFCLLLIVSYQGKKKPPKPRPTPTPTVTPSPSPTPSDPHVVRVVYFYPSDYIPDQRYTDRIDPFMRDVEDWYLSQLGKTYRTLPVEIIRGTQPTSYYNQGDFQDWARIYAEVGVDCGGNVNTFFWLARVLQHANGRSCGPWYGGTTYNGDVTISETSLDAEIVATQTGSCPNGFPLGGWRCSPNASRGGIAHELGHAFTLPHPERCPDNEPYCSQSVMWAWWLWPNTGFIETYFAPERSTLLGSAWFVKT